MVAACARTFHVVSGVEWRSNVMRCRPPPPPNTGAHVTVQSKYHSDSKALMGMIDKEWRKPAILLPPPPAKPLPERAAWTLAWARGTFGDLAHTAATTEEQMGTHGGTARPEGFARGFAQGSKARCGRQDSSRQGGPLASCESAEDNTYSHTRTCTPPPRSAILSLIPTQLSGCSGLPRYVGRRRRLGKQTGGPLAT